MRKLILPLILVTVIRRIITGYIDPNTGGMLFQLLAVLFGLLSGVLVFFSARIRMAFARVRRYLRERGEEDQAQTRDSQA